MSNDNYTIPSGPFRIEKKINKSLFIASCDHVSSASEAKQFHDRIKAEYKDATHNCLAFIAGPAGTTTHNGMSDDGEPRGTAGHPMLTTLIHSSVGEIAVVVTRYYGGVKLGTGGLVRAYSGIVKELLGSLPVKTKLTGNTLILNFDYKETSQIKRHVVKVGGNIIEEAYTDTVRMTVLIPYSQEINFKKLLPFDVGVTQDVCAT